MPCIYLLHNSATTDPDWNGLRGFWNRLTPLNSVAVINSENVYFIRHFIRNPGITVFFSNTKNTTHKHMQPSGMKFRLWLSSFSYRHYRPLPGINTAGWWCEHSTKPLLHMLTSHDSYFQTTLPWRSYRTLQMQSGGSCLHLNFNSITSMQTTESSFSSQRRSIVYCHASLPPLQRPEVSFIIPP
jgi:hypothetical protein